jgi:hypothetical protein
MTTRSPAVRAVGLRLPGGQRPAPQVTPTLLGALGVGTGGALLLAVAPAFTIAAAQDGAGTDAAITAGPLLALLALAPVAAAWLLAGTGRVGPAAGLLAGLAVLAPGRALVDLQLLTAPWQAARPELLVPTSLAPLRAGAGVWLLLAGHLLTLAAGALAAYRPGPGDGTRTGAAALTAALCSGAVAAVGLVLAPVRSADAHLVPRSVLDAGWLVQLGMLVLAGGVVVAACLFAGALDVDTGRGGLVGLAVGVTVTALPPLVVALFAASVHVAWGPVVALAGAAALVGTARLVRPGGAPGARPPAEPSLPAPARLHMTAGAVAVAAGLAALLGSVARQVTVPTAGGSPVLDAANLTVSAAGSEPELPVVRLLVPAGLLLLALGAVLVLPRRPGLAAAVRPCLGVAWAGMVLVAAAVLDTALTITQVAGVRAGVGLWAVTVALLIAPAIGLLTLLAGVAERDETDLSTLTASRASLVTGVLAALLAVPAFGLPLQTSPDYAPPGLWSHFGAASWGLLVAVVVVAATALLAPNSRPRRAVASLLGAAAVVALHLAQLPLAGGRAGADATVGAGLWFGLACLGTLLVGAALAWRAREAG